MIKIPYAFTCESLLTQEISTGNYDFSAISIFDRRELDRIPTKITKEMLFVVGIIGEPDDDEEEIHVRVKGKEVEFKFPALEYSFRNYDEVTVYQIAFNDFPVTVEGTVYFEVIHKNKTLMRYPVKFLVKEEM